MKRVIVLPKYIEVVVASFGGVGTKVLLSYISKYRQTNHPNDRDGFKHLSVPPLSFNPNVRFVYVYGDPILATISLFHRNFHSLQSRKLQRFLCKPILPISQETSLEQYASSGVDHFFFRTQFYNWYEDYLVYPTMFIKYEGLWDNVEAIAKFLDLPASTLESFPKRRERRSVKEGVPQKTLEDLQHIYGPFAEELNKLNNIEIRERHQIRNMVKVCSSKIYRTALWEQFGGSLKQRTKATYRKLVNRKRLTTR